MQNVVIGEIEKIRGKKRTTSTNIFIQCPFHDGDNTPSLGIYVLDDGKLPIGSFNCFGCGEKGVWNKLAKKLNLKEINSKRVKSFISSNGLDSIRNKLFDDNKLVMPYGLPYKKDWRSISGDLLHEVGTIIGYDDYEKIASLYFPITLDKKLIAVIKARLENKHGKLNYITIQGHTKERALFPYNKVIRMLKTNRYNNMVIVEGMRDSLYLIDNDIPALSILSTNGWSDYKRDKVASICRVYDIKPIIMMDYDRPKRNNKNPGMIAQSKIYKDLSTKIETHQIHLKRYAKMLGKDELDPADLPMKLVNKIHRLIIKHDYD